MALNNQVLAKAMISAMINSNATPAQVQRALNAFSYLPTDTNVEKAGYLMDAVRAMITDRIRTAEAQAAVNAANATAAQAVADAFVVAP